MDVLEIAKVCYEVNNAYRAAIGEMTKIDWEKLEDKAKTALVEGVLHSIDKPKTAEQQHNAWLENKIADGWKYGEKLDEKEKIHPQMIPFLGLPVEQRVKDSIFTAIIGAMSKIIVPEGKVKVVQIGKLPIRYIGLRPEYIDGTYQTGLHWKQGETQMVEESVAMKMLKHPDVYEAGEEPADYEPDKSVDEEPEEDKENSDDAIQAAKDAINFMNRKQAIIDFAEVNFSGVKLSDRDNLATLKQKVTGFIDQYGMN